MKGKIFVIEDDQPILDMMELMIRKLGYEPVLVAHAPESLEMIRQAPPVLIVLDVMMAPMNGWEILEWLRKDKMSREIPVILFTAAPSVNERMAQMHDPYLGMLQKPVSFTQLRTEIERFLH